MKKIFLLRQAPWGISLHKFFAKYIADPTIYHLSENKFRVRKYLWRLGAIIGNSADNWMFALGTSLTLNFFYSLESFVDDVNTDLNQLFKVPTDNYEKIFSLLWAVISFENNYLLSIHYSAISYCPLLTHDLSSIKFIKLANLPSRNSVEMKPNIESWD